MRAARLLVATLVAALAGCAVGPPPARDDIARQAMPNLKVP